MTRWLYLWLLRHHPGPFRARFGDEMVAIYDQAERAQGGWSLVASAAASLIRQQLRSVMSAPPASTVPDARAFEQHRRYLMLELRLAGQSLSLFAFAFVIDRRVVITGTLLLFGAGHVVWRLWALYRHRRTYLRRLSTERWLLRYEAERIRQSSQQSPKAFFYIAAIFGLSVAFQLALPARQPNGPDWPRSLAFAVLFVFAGIHHRRVAVTIERELGALDEGGDTTGDPLGPN